MSRPQYYGPCSQSECGPNLEVVGEGLFEGLRRLLGLTELEEGLGAESLAAQGFVGGLE